MAGMGCQKRGNGKAMAEKSAEPPMHYRTGGYVKNPARKPAEHMMPGGSMMPDEAMPMKGKMPMMKGKR